MLLFVCLIRGVGPSQDETPRGDELDDLADEKRLPVLARITVFPS
jgi:hypothetical protein